MLLSLALITFLLLHSLNSIRASSSLSNPPSGSPTYAPILISTGSPVLIPTENYLAPSPVSVPVPLPKKRRFIFRFDDVEDYYQTDYQQSFIQWCMDNDVSVSLGIIGGIIGQDDALKMKIQSCVNLGPEKCELFNHGMDAVTRLTDDLSKESLKRILKQSHDDIAQNFDSYQAVTMIPHQNAYGQNLIQALKELGYWVVSSSNDEGMSYNLTSIPMQMPQQTEIAKFSPPGWVKVSFRVFANRVRVLVYMNCFQYC